MKKFELTRKLMPCDLPLKHLVKRIKENGWEKSVFLIDKFINSCSCTTTGTRLSVTTPTFSAASISTA